MERVVVTVKVPFEEQALDLELPSDLQAEQLVTLLVSALGGGLQPAARYSLEAYPPGRVLRADESLTEAGAWSGSWLVLRES